MNINMNIIKDIYQYVAYYTRKIQILPTTTKIYYQGNDFKILEITRYSILLDIPGFPWNFKWILQATSD